MYDHIHVYTPLYVYISPTIIIMNRGKSVYFLYIYTQMICIYIYIYTHIHMYSCIQMDRTIDANETQKCPHSIAESLRKSNMKFSRAVPLFWQAVWCIIRQRRGPTAQKCRRGAQGPTTAARGPASVCLGGQSLPAGCWWGKRESQKCKVHISVFGGADEEADGSSPRGKPSVHQGPICLSLPFVALFLGNRARGLTSLLSKMGLPTRDYHTAEVLSAHYPRLVRGPTAVSTLGRKH